MRIVLTSVLLSLLVSSFALADDFRSSFGFTAKTPSSWLILTRDEARENPDLFGELASVPGLGSIDQDLMAQIQHKIISGSVEMIFVQSLKASSFTDNINILKQVGRIPGEADLAETCGQLPAIFSQYFGRPIQSHQCKLSQVAGLPALYLEFDGAIEGTQSMQYQVQRSSSVQIIVTATAKETTVDALRSDFSPFIESIEFGAAEPSPTP